MKVCKPLKVPILTRIVEFKRNPALHVGAVIGFPLANPRALVDEMSFWMSTMPELGAAVFDEGITKARGELLVAGRFFAPGGKPIAASFVRAQVGAVDKRLAVIGDRYWRRGVPTEPKTMVEMPVDWAHAFGGKDYARNPYGIGVHPIERDGEQVQPLPNIERMGALLSSPRERPNPDCFLPMDMAFEQRRARAGTFGSDYLERWAPGLSGDHQPTVYNTAAEDQWLASHFRGDERILIENMCADKPRIESALPSLVTRAFVTQRTRDGERFVEVGLRCDTVWLFPSIGLGAVIFHGAIAVADDDAGDVAHLVVACEEPGGARPIEHYREALERRLDKDKGSIGDLSDSDLMPSRESGVAANMDLGAIGQWIKSDYIAMKNAHRGAERRHEQTRAELIAEGIDVTGTALDQPWPALELPPPTDDFDALKEYLLTMEARVEKEEARAKQEMSERQRELLAMHGEDASFAEAAEPPKGGPPTYRAEDHLREMAELAAAARASGSPDLEIEELLANPGFCEQFVQVEHMEREGYLLNAHLLSAAAPMTTEASELARVVIQAARDSDVSLAERDFTGADFRGLDLSGMDFSRAFMEGADLREANLNGANLEGAVLARADLRGAKLERARLSGINLGAALLDTAIFDGADLTKAVLMNAHVGAAVLARANLAGADFFGAACRGVDLTGANLDKVSFMKADLTGVSFAGASLVQATFVECTLDGCDFSDANLHKATIVSSTGTGVCFARARLTEAVLSHQNALPKADFRDAQLEKCCLRTTTLVDARFDRARMSMSDLSACDATRAVFARAVLDGALLIRTVLEDASLRGANLTDTIVSKSRLGGADFTGAQLTRADFTRARGDGRTTFAEAVVRFTRFDREPARSP